MKESIEKIVWKRYDKGGSELAIAYLKRLLKVHKGNHMQSWLKGMIDGFEVKL